MLRKTKAQLLKRLDVLRVFGNDVLANDPDVGDAVCYVVGNVVVAKKEYLERKVPRFSPELISAVRKSDPAFA
jgi:hypothetical protein